ncbi:SNF2-related protein [Bradyrhizobium sp. 170]|uniref:SNF2-related protein n=1 Tax=Bradyrhizobium sp. 170 TaxID=2782641 RepID=UPI001FFF09AF|nr:SNF2-related protein [Bradyrhizobium sp. 170]UPK02824.1 restriction endonuclease [Bradyrhizobium sp. 170]
MARMQFSYDIVDGGIFLRLLENRAFRSAAPIAVDDWATRTSDLGFSAIARLLALVENAENTVDPRADGLFVDHHSLAGLTEPQALSLGLVPATKLLLQVETQNLITDPNFRIVGRWIGEGNRPYRTKRDGAFLLVNDQRYRIPEPLFSLIEAIDSFAAKPLGPEGRDLSAIARLQNLLPQEPRDQLRIDSYFNSFRVQHATAFSLSLRTVDRSFDFDPILFGRSVSAVAETDGALIDEAGSLLTAHQNDLFARERFRSFEDCKSSYVIERGVYVTLDPSLRQGLTVVRQMQRADSDTRKRFARTPQVYLKEALAGALSDDDIEKLFIETEQYSARVIDVGIWSPPVLPWIKGEPNDWLPEKFGLRIGGEYVVLKAEQLEPLRQQITEAAKSGEPYVEFGKDKTRIPTTEETQTALRDLVGLVRPTLDHEKTPPTTIKDEPEAEHKNVLIIEENFDAIGYRRSVKPRLRLQLGVPSSVKPSLMKHQLSGLNWLQEVWRLGYSGGLLADDMGLGKTLQALAFLSWLREGTNSTISSSEFAGPILIVAPTGLLANWEKEHGSHLFEPGLGNVCRVYGRHLKVLKVDRSNDINRGFPSLDRRELQQSNWVLTTYETLRDYHLSFASIRFSCVVFDEMQKIKSPSSLLTRAAKTLNSNFVLGLTGTPIENQLADLWCLMDIISPGTLGDLKSFCRDYQPNGEAQLENLRKSMLDPSALGPAPVLRRMKADHLDGLPKKHIHIRRRLMQGIQAQNYSDIVARAREPKSGPILETLHFLRGVSLHPTWPPATEIVDPKSFIEQSARLTETFLILDEIAAQREKVLIFLESLDLQEHLALMIQRRYKLARRPMQINGEVSGEKRQNLVDAFQSEIGSFDVMILSPRAGGVGLTLTSANHVIHLSRWWNPAVEDQCTDRVYRIGAKRDVHVYYPLAVHPVYNDGSFDELLHVLLEKKRLLSNRMLVPPVDSDADRKWFAQRLGRRTPIAQPNEVAEIDMMEPNAFEEWALRRCVGLGWEAYRTPRSYDGGADGLLSHRISGARAIVQCKHKQDVNSACGPEAIENLLRARSNYAGVTRLFALTNAKRFSRAAEERARNHGIYLVARSGLEQWPSQLSE